jgi:hypothetical protein
MHQCFDYNLSHEVRCSIFYLRHHSGAHKVPNFVELWVAYFWVRVTQPMSCCNDCPGPSQNRQRVWLPWPWASRPDPVELRGPERENSGSCIAPVPSLSTHSKEGRVAKFYIFLPFALCTHCCSYVNSNFILLLKFSAFCPRVTSDFSELLEPFYQPLYIIIETSTSKLEGSARVWSSHLLALTHTAKLSHLSVLTVH